MPKRKLKPRHASQELDGVYVLKIVMYLILGAQWLWFVRQDATVKVPIPIGLIVGVAFAMHEHFQIDRKIEFAILLIAALVGFWSRTGVIVSVL